MRKDSLDGIGDTVAAAIGPGAANLVSQVTNEHAVLDPASVGHYNASSSRASSAINNSSLISLNTTFMASDEPTNAESSSGDGRGGSMAHSELNDRNQTVVQILQENVLSECRGFANKEVINVSFGRATVTHMRKALESAWMGLSARQQAMTNRSILAARILRAAANGERDPVRLREHALADRNDGL